MSWLMVWTDLSESGGASGFRNFVLGDMDYYSGSPVINNSAGCGCDAMQNRGHMGLRYICCFLDRVILRCVAPQSFGYFWQKKDETSPPILTGEAFELFGDEGQ